jgi:putative ATP-binding cassette transporter
MRATAGLWQAGHGRILRPPLQHVMFLPQQPYLTLGSLRDQLLYVMPPDVPVSDDRLLSVLQDVQLEGVLERIGGLDVPRRDWPSLLSLGEQQTLAFARLLLVIPEFVFLDEALGALPAERVRGLYDLLAQTATTYVSVASGTDPRAYHDTLLQLHGDGTWTATELDTASDTEWNRFSGPVAESLQVG